MAKIYEPISDAELKKSTVVNLRNEYKKLSNFYHIAHGGALMSLADTAMGATCLSVNKKVVTQSMNSFFLKASREGAHLTATGHILHNGRKTVVCETEIRDEEGIVLCKATANFFVIGQCVEEQA